MRSLLEIGLSNRSRLKMWDSKMIEIRVGIKGQSPLLMNRFPDEDPNEGSKPTARGEKGTPRERAENKTYELDDGTLYIPGVCIFSAIMEAGKFHKLGRNKVTTQRSSLVPAGIFMKSDGCSLKTKKWEVDSRPVVNPSTGGRIICHRPRLDEWATEFVIDVDTDMFSENFVRQLIDDAGAKIGLLDYRPARKGPFGRFKVINWKVNKS